MVRLECLMYPNEHANCVTPGVQHTAGVIHSSFYWPVPASGGKLVDYPEPHRHAYSLCHVADRCLCQTH
jgi:hypothetical protein